MVVDIIFGLRSTTFGETDRFCFGVKSFADFLASPVCSIVSRTKLKKNNIFLLVYIIWYLIRKSSNVTLDFDALYMI